MSQTPTQDARSAESLVTDVVDDFIERLNLGEEPDVEAYARRYPDIAPVLRRMLPALCVMRTLSSDSISEPALGDVASETSRPLGDYRIIREVGRGGMGVVYEAEQVSLNRRRVFMTFLPLQLVS